MKMRLFLPFALAAVFSQATFGQISPSWIDKYQHTPSAGFSNESRCVAVAPTGEIFVLADATSNLDLIGNPSPTTRHYAVILKYDLQGNKMAEKIVEVFNHQVSGFDHKGAFDIKIDAVGDVYVGYAIFNVSTGYDIAIGKYSNNLVHQWTSVFNPSSDEKGVSVVLESTKAAYALVSSASGSSTRYRVIRADGTMATFSTSFYDFNPDDDVLNDLALDANFDLYVTGYQLQATYKTLMTVKISQTGALLWKNIFNGGSINRDDVGMKIALGPVHVFVAGVSDQGPPTNNDGMVAKYDINTGTIGWIKYFDHNNGNDVAGFLHINAAKFGVVGIHSGNSVVLRRLSSVTGTSHNTNDKYVYSPVPVEPHNALNGASIAGMVYSANDRLYIGGNILATNTSSQAFSATWLARFRISNSGRVAQSIFLEGDIPAEGSFATSQHAADVTIYPGFATVLLLQDQVATHASHASEQISLTGFTAPLPFRTAFDAGPAVLSLWPVPATEKLNFVAETAMRDIQVYDITGKFLAGYTVNESYYELNLSGLKPGVYLVKIALDRGGTKIEKFIVN